MKKILISASMVVLCMGSVTAHAAAIFNATGLSSPASTITFGEHSQTTASAVTNEFSDLGVTFSPNLYYSTQTGFPNIFQHTVTNFGDGADVFDFSINFLTDQTEAAFAMVSNGSIWDFTAYLNGSLLESFSQIVNTSSPNFYGFSGITFDEIHISSSVNDFMIIDNLQLGNTENVPEPASIALLALGLAGIGFSRKKNSA